MASISAWTIQSQKGGQRHVREWPNPNATWIALLSHGYAEHIGRYELVAETLRQAGAAVVGPDHEGHGRSSGEQALIADFEAVIDDLHGVAMRVQDKYPALPMILIGHSMGGMIAARYAQHFADELTALVLSGPMFGTREILKQLVAMDPIPNIPIDPSSLSRDPAVGKAYNQDPLVWHGPFKRTTLKAMLATMEAVQAGPSLGKLPLFYAHGGSDALVPMAATRPMIMHLRGDVFKEKIYSGAMHEIFNETNRQEVIADVIAFAREALSKKSAQTNIA